MSTAVFIQSQGDSIPDVTRQILLVSHNEDVLIYHRLTDGKQGPGNKWSTLESFDDLVSSVSLDEVLIANPVGVHVTDNDVEQIQALGYSPVLTTKAINAAKKIASNINIAGAPAIETICEMYEAVSLNSQILKDLIVDGRRTAVANPARTVITVEVEPEAEAETIASKPTLTKEKPSMSLSLATIPSKEIAERYVNRKIHGKEDFEVFDVARRNKRNILIYGPTGPGKTMAVTAYAAARGLRMVSIPCNAALDVSQLLGKLVPNEEGNLEWVDGPLTEIARTGGIAYFDEGNFAPPKIVPSIFSLTDGRRTLQLLDHHGETIEAHPDLTIIMAMNPGYIGTGRLNAAFRNRFAVQIQWDYDPEVEDKLVSAKNLLTVARQLRAEADKGMYETPIATNMLLEFIELADENTGLGYQFAVENFIAHFEPEEQASVRLVLQTHEANIREDLGLDMSDSQTFNINI